MNLPQIAIVGPTASGKTSKAVALAKAVNGEIISADSRQLYKRMDIGTGKDLEEYLGVPYHMIDIAEPGEKFNLFRFLDLSNKILTEINERGATPIICGGTGLYVESLLKGVKLPEVPENQRLRESLRDKTLEELTAILASMKTLHNTTDVDNVKRAIRAIEIQTYYFDNPDLAPILDRREDANNALISKQLIIGVDIPREERRERITRRLKTRLEQGMVAEIEGLLDSGVKSEDLIYYGLEYKFVTQYVTGELTYDQMYNGLETAIHQFAKRQMTWFRGMERRGFKIHWLPYSLTQQEFTSRVMDLCDSKL